MIDLTEIKYADRPDFLLILARALAYFEDAEQQPMPTLLKRIRWIDVKRYAQQGARYIVQHERKKAQHPE